MLIIVLWWLQFFLVVVALGTITVRALAKIIPGLEENYSVFQIFWLGFVSLLATLQIYSLLFPINHFTLLLLWAVALVSFIFWRGVYVGLFTNLKQRIIKSHCPFLGAGVLLATVLFLAFSAAQIVVQSDAYSYHFNAVRWISDFPAIPGLVHIHDRLAFNSSFFLFAALNNTWLVRDAYYHTALSFIVLALSVQWISILFARGDNPLQRLFAFTTLPFVLAAIILNNRVPSLSTDMCTYVLSLVFAMELLNEDRFNYIVLAGLAACLFSFKLLGAVAVFILLASMGVKLVKGLSPKGTVDSLDKRILLVSTAVLILYVTGFLLRNAILSGWLLYPVPFAILNLHLPWSIPMDEVVAQKELLTNFARTKSSATAIGFSTWFVQWIGKWNSIFEVVLLLASGFFSLGSLLFSGLRKEMRTFKEQILLLYAFSGLTLVLWFYGAPSIRFGRVYFWILFAASILPLLLMIRNRFSKKYQTACCLTVCIICTALYLCYPQKLFRTETPALFSLKKPDHIPVSEVAVNNDQPPLKIYYPYITLPKCGNSPLPCTPYPRKVIENGVRQRKPGDMKRGFVRGQSVLQ